MPGSGKSTLTAALTARGFRLLSDEFGIVRLADAQLLPLLRPIGLKNESIDVIARFAPQAPLGPRFPKTRKGTVAHLAPADAAIAARHVPARAALIVFPRFDPAVETQVAPIPKARAFGRLAVNSFNYETLGPAGFDAVSRLVAHSDSFQLVFRDLEQAINAIEQRLGTD
jgi:HprK-related kinase A